MINPSGLLSREHSYYNMTYSYKEGLLEILPIIVAIAIFALISMIISLIIGIRKKDCLAIFVTNILVKTIAMVIYQILDGILYFIVILYFILIIIAEGFIYNKVLKYKKHNGIIVSIVCNIMSIVASFIVIRGVTALILLF